MVAATPDADAGTLTPPSTREGNLLPLESSTARSESGTSSNPRSAGTRVSLQSAVGNPLGVTRRISRSHRSRGAKRGVFFAWQCVPGGRRTLVPQQKKRSLSDGTMGLLFAVARGHAVKMILTLTIVIVKHNCQRIDASECSQHCSQLLKNTGYFLIKGIAQAVRRHLKNARQNAGALPPRNPAPAGLDRKALPELEQAAGSGEMGVGLKGGVRRATGRVTDSRAGSGGSRWWRRGWHSCLW